MNEVQHDVIERHCPFTDGVTSIIVYQQKVLCVLSQVPSLEALLWFPNQYRSDKYRL